MKKESMMIDGRTCVCHQAENPEFLIIQPADEHDLEALDHEIDLICQQSKRPFTLCAYKVEHWNSELTPWPAPPVFGREPFGQGAEESLRFLTSALLPRLDATGQLPVILGGYSLAGLFALWCGYQSARFAAVVGVSPSVWYPGWMAFAESHQPQCKVLYLSLGNKEEQTRHQVMATVGDNIRQYNQYLAQTAHVKHLLEWNEGNHFADSDRRTTRGLAWAMSQL